MGDLLAAVAPPDGARSGAGFLVSASGIAVCLAVLEGSVCDPGSATGDFAGVESPRLRIDPSILPRPGFFPEFDSGSEAGSGSGSGRGAPGSLFNDTRATCEPLLSTALREEGSPILDERLEFDEEFWAVEVDWARDFPPGMDSLSDATVEGRLSEGTSPPSPACPKTLACNHFSPGPLTNAPPRNEAPTSTTANNT
jgi:hypothetical protein